MSKDFAASRMNLLGVILIFLLTVVSGSFESNGTLIRLMDGPDFEEKRSSPEDEMFLILDGRSLAALRELAEAGHSKPEVQNSTPGAQNLMPGRGNSLQGNNIVGNISSEFRSENSPNHFEHPDGLNSMTGINYLMPRYNAAGDIIPEHNYISSMIPSSYPVNGFLIPRYVAANPRQPFLSPDFDFRGRNYDIQQTQATPDLKSFLSQPGSIISGMPSEVSYDGIGKSFMSADPVLIIDGNSEARFYPSNQGMNSEQNYYYPLPVSTLLAQGMPSEVSDGGIRNFLANMDPLMASNGNSRARFYPSIQGKNSMNTGQYAPMPERIEMASQNAGTSPPQKEAAYRMNSEKSNIDAAPGSMNLEISSEKAKIQLTQGGKYSFLLLK